MQLKTFIVIGLASLATAAPAVNAPARTFDLLAVTDTFGLIQTQIDKMVNDVKAYTGDPSGLAAIQEDSDTLAKIIGEGTAKVKASPAMGLMDAINVLGPVGVLSSKVDEIIFALAFKRTEFEKMNLNSVVLGDLQQQKTAADG